VTYEGKQRVTAKNVFRRTLIAAGVTRISDATEDGYAFSLIGNGQVRVTGYTKWAKIAEHLREVRDTPEVGWRALAFRQKWSGNRPMVIMSGVSLARLLANYERMAVELGRSWREDAE
jgi:hypothetical protein